MDRSTGTRNLDFCYNMSMLFLLGGSLGTLMNYCCGAWSFHLVSDFSLCCCEKIPPEDEACIHLDCLVGFFCFYFPLAFMLGVGRLLVTSPLLRLGFGIYPRIFIRKAGFLLINCPACLARWIVAYGMRNARSDINTMLSIR